MSQFVDGMTDSGRALMARVHDVREPDSRRAIATLTLLELCPPLDECAELSAADRYGVLVALAGAFSKLRGWKQHAADLLVRAGSDAVGARAFVEALRAIEEAQRINPTPGNAENIATLRRMIGLPSTQTKARMRGRRAEK